MRYWIECYLRGRSEVRPFSDRISGYLSNLITLERVDHIFSYVMDKVKSLKHRFSAKSRVTRLSYTASRLDKIFEPYLGALMEQRSRRLKPLYIIVITDDGGAGDDFRTFLDSAAGKLDSLHAPQYQVGIQIVQFGANRVAGQVLRDLKQDLLENSDSFRAGSMVDISPSSLTKFTGRSGKVIMQAVLSSVHNRRLEVESKSK